MIVIYDGNNTLIRNNAVTELYHNGIRTSGMCGMLAQLRHDLETIQNNHIVSKVIAVWDYGSNYRKSIYPNYKAQRKEKREKTLETNPNFYDELKYQLETMHNFLPKIGIPSVRISGWEADDIIAYLATHSYEDCVIVSTDKDLLQLVSDKIYVYQPTKKILYTKNNFKELCGVNVNQFVDYKILVGDSSDNIPGISGIGDKTAIKLLEEFGSVSKMLRNKEKLMKSKTTSRIITPQGLGTIALNRALMDLSIVNTEDIAPTLDAILEEKLEANLQELIKFASKYGMSKILVDGSEWRRILYSIQDVKKPE